MKPEAALLAVRGFIRAARVSKRPIRRLRRFRREIQKLIANKYFSYLSFFCVICEICGLFVCARGHAALQFLKPIQHHGDLRGGRFLFGGLDHQEALAVGVLSEPRAPASGGLVLGRIAGLATPPLRSGL